jgi:hypothetical protein
MTQYICLPKYYSIIIFTILIGAITWYIHYNKINNYNSDRLLNKINYLLKSQQIKKNFLNKRDNAVIYDKLSPPERRLPEHNYPNEYIKKHINISSRGLPDNYQLIGVILRNNTESAFNLFGRQLFSGSNQWEYYVQGKMHDTSIKLPIEIKGNKEIDDGQNIYIPGTNSTFGTYHVKLYKYDTPRYNPFN